VGAAEATRILASSYALAAQELSLVREKLSGITDENCVVARDE